MHGLSVEGLSHALQGAGLIRIEFPSRKADRLAGASAKCRHPHPLSQGDHTQQVEREEQHGRVSDHRVDTFFTRAKSSFGIASVGCLPSERLPFAHKCARYCRGLLMQPVGLARDRSAEQADRRQDPAVKDRDAWREQCRGCRALPVVPGGKAPGQRRQESECADPVIGDGRLDRDRDIGEQAHLAADAGIQEDPGGRGSEVAHQPHAYDRLDQPRGQPSARCGRQVVAGHYQCEKQHGGGRQGRGPANEGLSQAEQDPDPAHPGDQARQGNPVGHSPITPAKHCVCMARGRCGGRTTCRPEPPRFHMWIPMQSESWWRTTMRLDES